jgi:DNA modification methylase
MLILGDALTELKKLDSELVDCIITSPPYWALRDYKVKGQIGQEKTIDEYVNKLVEIFNECKRVLKKEGTCWIVLGDTYAGQGGTYSNPSKKLSQEHKDNMMGGLRIKNTQKIQGIQDKSLCMIPERFAIKMIDNGWILRNKIIWYKPNCMPSSATDRFTVDFEYIYFFVKSKRYYFKTQYEELSRPPQKYYPSKTVVDNVDKYNNGMWSRTIKGHAQNPNRLWGSEQGRIKRTVWKIPPKPFPEAHFAVFPEELVKQCLDAGCPEQGTVLDPFSGAGTTALIALKNNRQYIGIELNKDYIEISNKRLKPYLEQKTLTSLFSE